MSESEVTDQVPMSARRSFVASKFKAVTESLKNFPKKLGFALRRKFKRRQKVAKPPKPEEDLVVVLDRYRIERHASIQVTLDKAFHHGFDMTQNHPVTLYHCDYSKFQTDDLDSDWLYYKGLVFAEYKAACLAKDHPHVLKPLSYEVNESSRLVFIVFECMNSFVSLKDFLLDERVKTVLCAEKKNQDIAVKSENLAKSLVRQVVSVIGFYHLHLLGLGNMDLANVYLDLSQYEKQAEAGAYNIASDKWAAPPVRVHIRSVIPVSETLHQSLGSPQFQTPELLLLGETLADLTDVWYVGLLTYILAVGKIPYTEVTEADNQDGTLPVQAVKPLEWMSADFQHFLRRSLTIPYHRANINELASHPFLNLPSLSGKAWVPIAKAYALVDYVVDVQAYWLAKSMHQIDHKVIDEVRLGYYNALNLEEDDSGWVFMNVCEDLCQDLSKEVADEDFNIIELGQWAERPVEPVLPWTGNRPFYIPSQTSSPTSQELFWYNAPFKPSQATSAIFWPIYHEMFGSNDDGQRHEEKKAAASEKFDAETRRATLVVSDDDAASQVGSDYSEYDDDNEMAYLAKPFFPAEGCLSGIEF